MNSRILSEPHAAKKACQVFIFSYINYKTALALTSDGRPSERQSTTAAFCPPPDLSFYQPIDSDKWLNAVPTTLSYSDAVNYCQNNFGGDAELASLDGTFTRHSSILSVAGSEFVNIMRFKRNSKYVGNKCVL